ncbi:MAG TPA: ABC transporter ATP-binding protein [Acidimicrobiales bacterium]
MTAPVLELDDVDAAYGPFRALFGVSLTVPDGGAVALLGPNGSGKTTVARVASGLLAPTRGRLRVGGDDLTGQPTWAVARCGVLHAPEGRSVFGTLTVEENLVLGLGGAGAKPDIATGLERAFELFPRLGERRTQQAGTLSGGEQRMLSLARVMARPPKLLIVDELSLGLAPIVVEEVYDTLAKIRGAGTALLIIEQHVHHALEIADDAAILHQGRVAFHGPAAGLIDRADLLHGGLDA